MQSTRNLTYTAKAARRLPGLQRGVLAQRGRRAARQQRGGAQARVRVHARREGRQPQARRGFARGRARRGVGVVGRVRLLAAHESGRRVGQNSGRAWPGHLLEHAPQTHAEPFKQRPMRAMHACQASHLLCI